MSYAVATDPFISTSFLVTVLGGGSSCSEITVSKLEPSVSMRTRRGVLTLNLNTVSLPCGSTPQPTKLSSKLICVVSVSSAPFHVDDTVTVLPSMAVIRTGLDDQPLESDIAIPMYRP